MAEVGLAALVVGQCGAIHHLQQDVEQILMGLLDLIEQQNRVGIFANALDEQPALVVTHITGRGSDQTRHRVLLHVLAHVEAQKRNTEGLGQLFREFGLANTCGAREQETTARAIDTRQSRAPAFDGTHDRLDRRILAEDDTLECDLEVREPIPIGAARTQGRDVGHPRDHLLDVAHPHRLALFTRGA